MDFKESDRIQAIRAEARAFAEEYVTDEVRDHEYYSGDGVNLAIHRAMGARGWVLPRFPRDAGGAGMSAGEAEALFFELAVAGVPKVGVFTTGIPAKAIREFGNDKLRAKVLPEVATGNSLICLGYTEPESGSDVAAAKTRAISDRDHWTINGQKVFTTFAHLARYCFLLARTDLDAPKHKGLTMFLIPLDSAGIEIHPVATMGGERTNIVYYSDVSLPDSYRVGEVNDGWRVLRVALEEEHTGGLQFEAALISDSIERWANGEGPDGAKPIADQTVRNCIARIRITNEVARLLGALQSYRLDNDIPLGLVGPMAALYGTESYLSNAQSALDLCGPAGIVRRGDPGAVGNGILEHLYRAAIGSTIYGGTSEIMREQIATRGLGLPRLRA